VTAVRLLVFYFLKIHSNIIVSYISPRLSLYSPSATMERYRRAIEQ
jgi:hypothetical protein